MSKMKVEEFLLDYIKTNQDCINAGVLTIREFFDQWGSEYDTVILYDVGFGCNTDLVSMKFGEILIGYEIDRRSGKIGLGTLCFLEPYEVKEIRYKRIYEREKG